MADPVTVGVAVGWGISAVGWVVSPIISKLHDKVVSYLGFDGSEKLKELADKVLELELMLEVVELEKIREVRDRLENALKELRSAFYEAEDFLDDVEYDRVERQILSRKRKWGKRVSSALRKSFRLKKQASGSTSDDAPLGMSKRKELKKILKKIENSINKAHKILQLLKLARQFQRLGLQTGDANARRAVTTATPPRKVIGRDEDRDKIIVMLHETVGDDIQESNSALPYSIIGIHGIPGSGKSTLAQHVYAHEENGDHFDPVMWVHVTENFSVQTIWRAMFNDAAGKHLKEHLKGPEYESLNTLEKHLKEELRGKRFLLVLDDVWYNKDAIRQQELQQILSPLRVGKAGSKILVTSRTSDALLALGPVKCIPISDLDDNVFLELFMHYALEGDQNRRMFEMIGADIAKKLKRSPLAARIVGGQLRIRPNVEFWRSVRDRDLLNETMGALWWSYQHLDEQVRRCFAYCSMFPRRHQLKRDELVNLWVAEGFINISNTGNQIEGIGQSYFDELVSCSFLQQKGRAGDSDTVCFTIHDLLYDLAERVAGSDCFTVLENNVEIPPTVRHLYIDSGNAMEIAEQICKLENLRTLICTDIFGQGITERVLDGMLNKLRRLRVVQVKLVSEYYNFIAIPASIGNLKHLRCLSIYEDWSFDICLPSTFDKLYHLQILEYPSRNNLRGSCVRSINNLINLRHVKSSSTSDFFDGDHVTLEIPGIGRLKSLQTLGCFGVRKETGYELQQLEGLNHLQGILRISGLGNVESKEQALEAKLADKEGLTSLALEYGVTDECPPDLQADILEGLRPPSSVTQLRIHGYHSRRYPSWLLGNQNAQRNLQRLQLKHCDELEDLPEIGEIFIHLHELRLESLRSLKSLPRLPENLKKLVIKWCTSLAFICVEDVEMLRTMFAERASQADPSLKSVNPEGIAGFSPDQCDRFKETLYDCGIFHKYGNSYYRCYYNLILEKVFPSVGGNCIEEDSQLLIPGSVEHLSIELCNITDSALRNCLIGCTSITCLELSGILCLTAIPGEFLTRLRELSITKCVDLTILHGLNDLRNLEDLTIERCPNLKALQDSEKVGALCKLTVDDLSLVPELLSAEGRSSLTELIISLSKERKEAEFLQQLTSLESLQFLNCDWDTLPENLEQLTSLEYLGIFVCEKIRSLPVLPKSLEAFQVGYCDQEFMDNFQAPGDPNWQKIEHVPSILIDGRELR